MLPSDELTLFILVYSIYSLKSIIGIGVGAGAYILSRFAVSTWRISLNTLKALPRSQLLLLC